MNYSKTIVKQKKKVFAIFHSFFHFFIFFRKHIIAYTYWTTHKYICFIITYMYIHFVNKDIYIKENHKKFEQVHTHSTHSSHTQTFMSKDSQCFAENQ